MSFCLGNGCNSLSDLHSHHTLAAVTVSFSACFGISDTNGMTTVSHNVLSGSRINHLIIFTFVNENICAGKMRCSLPCCKHYKTCPPPNTVICLLIQAACHQTSEKTFGEKLYYLPIFALKSPRTASDL